MARAAKACSEAGCPNLQPCPDHQRKPWDGSRRRTKVGSGHAQSKNRAYVFHRDGDICHVCGLPGANEADHVIALSEGGEDHIDNMAPIHSIPCHRDKTQAEAARART